MKQNVSKVLLITGTMCLCVMANIALGATITPTSMMIYTNKLSGKIVRRIGINLNGNIDRSTDVDLIKVYKSLNNGKPEDVQYIDVSINSDGGDIEAAIRTGDFIRQKKMSTMVFPDPSCRCASAAVLILLGGVERNVYGKIGLHRAYSEKASNSESESKANYENINRQIREYLKRMNIPEGLLDEMNSIPPGETKWLDWSDDADKLRSLQIVGEDPVYADQRDSEIAKLRGISKKEYYLRLQRAKAETAKYDLTDEDSRKARGQLYYDIINGKR